jgi:hypothetical protein
MDTKTASTSCWKIWRSSALDGAVRRFVRDGVAPFLKSAGAIRDPQAGATSESRSPTSRPAGTDRPARHGGHRVRCNEPADQVHPASQMSSHNSVRRCRREEVGVMAMKRASPQARHPGDRSHRLGTPFVIISRASGISAQHSIAVGDRQGCRRIAQRRGPQKAIVAIQHSMLIGIWHMGTQGRFYDDPGADYFNRLNSGRARKRAISQLEAMGYHVNLTHATGSRTPGIACSTSAASSIVRMSFGANDFQDRVRFWHA